MYFDRFTEHYFNIIKNAYLTAKKEAAGFVTLKHLIYSLLTEKGSIGAEILRKGKINVQELRLKKPTKVKKTEPVFDDSFLTVLQKSIVTAYSLKHKYVGTEHLLYSILLQPKTQKFLSQNQITKLLDNVASVLKTTSKFSDMVQEFDTTDGQEIYYNNDPQAAEYPTKQKFSIDQFTSDLTNAEVQRNITPVIGRDKEIERLVQILCRKSKNNPVLIGDPGVGKTAIVEGLAKKIILRQVPDILLNKKILELDLTGLLAGTIFRGEFENRLKFIMDYLKNNPHIILFIDELHNIVGSGSASGTLDTANILKPALARGQIRCIGATTFEEYKKHIEKDSALERRFQPLIIEEPSVQDSIKILEGIKGYYEKYHHVQVLPEAIVACTYFSDRYLTDKFLPDKAIDLLDEAAAKINIQQSSRPELKTLRTLEQEHTNAAKEKETAVLHENWEKAAFWQLRQKSLTQKITILKKEYQQNLEKSLGKVTPEQIREIISLKTNIPLAKLSENSSELIFSLEKNLNQEIVGQEEAITEICKIIKKSKAQIGNANRPLGSFLFLGPSGVGKTELAKILAKKYFNTPKALVRLDMSEFTESFNISKLLGAPAGYVGYRESNSFTDKIRQQPHSLVLFDEIEKAHPKVYNLLLQILEDGYLTDALGKNINFKNTLIIMTSNIGAQEFNRQNQIGFLEKTDSDKDISQTKLKVLEQLKKHFNVEFLNRIDKTIVFNPLSENNLQAIAKLQLNELTTRVPNLSLQFSSKLTNFIAQKAAGQQGARAVRKIIEDFIEVPLAEKILQPNFTKKILKISLKNKQVVVI